MSVYIVTWNLNGERAYGAARTAFLNHLAKYENCADSSLETVRFVSTTQTAQQVSDYLRQKMDDNDRLFVSKVKAGERAGWLEKDVWTWIEERE